MSIENNTVRKRGVSIISREAVMNRKQFFEKKKIYWEQFEKKIGLHKIVKNALLNLQEPTAEFLVVLARANSRVFGRSSTTGKILFTLSKQIFS